MLIVQYFSIKLASFKRSVCCLEAVTFMWLFVTFLLGMVGIGCVALGIGSGFGITMAAGQQFVAFIGTLPFLILGVGIDDMFIIIGGIDIAKNCHIFWSF